MGSQERRKFIVPLSKVSTKHSQFMTANILEILCYGRITIVENFNWLSTNSECAFSKIAYFINCDSYNSGVIIVYLILNPQKCAIDGVI